MTSFQSREPVLSIGEFKITIGPDHPLAGHEFFFKPSLERIMTIGTPAEIVDIFATLQGAEIHQILSSAQQAYGQKIPAAVWQYIASKPVESKIIKAAMIVMQACCYRDPVPLIGEFKGWKYPAINYRAGLMPLHIVIANAKNLMEHGVIGKANLRIPAREEKGFSREFNAMEYITSARVNFGMSIDEAKDLSMTELHMLIKQKFPPAKGFTREEREALMAQYELEREQALGLKPKTHEWKKMTLSDVKARSMKNAKR